LISFGFTNQSGLGFPILNQNVSTPFLFFNQPSSVSIAYISISYYITNTTSATVSLNWYSSQLVNTVGTPIVTNVFGTLGTGATIYQVYTTEITGTSLTIVSGQSLSTLSLRTVSLSCTATTNNNFVILGVAIGYG
jgi:hypothetical protein